MEESGQNNLFITFWIKRTFKELINFFINLVIFNFEIEL